MISRKRRSKGDPKLELSGEDQAALKALERQRLSARVWRRVRILQLLDRGWTMDGFADAMRRIAAAFPRASRIHVVMDNLNTHCEKSLIHAFGPSEGRRLWRRFIVHYTPKHGSWLNPAEIEVSLWSREYLGRDRVATFEELRARTRAWNARASKSRRRINWQFTTTDARRVFGYEQSAYAWGEALVGAMTDQEDEHLASRKSSCRTIAGTCEGYFSEGRQIARVCARAARH